MAKMMRHDYCGIHKALNNMIIAEVKAALSLLPDKSIETEDNVPLCHIVLSPSCDYEPRDVAVEKVYLDADGEICVVDRNDEDEWIIDADCDCLDITDFDYLINQIADKLEGDKTHLLHYRSFEICGYIPENALRSASCELITV